MYRVGIFTIVPEARNFRGQAPVVRFGYGLR